MTGVELVLFVRSVSGVAVLTDAELVSVFESCSFTAGASAFAVTFTEADAPAARFPLSAQVMVSPVTAQVFHVPDAETPGDDTPQR